jgi:nucleoside 2-deoxyribosyltransferase
VIRLFGYDWKVEQFYQYSLAWLEVSDYVLVVPGNDWKQSKGTVAEIEHAEALGIPVCYTYSELVELSENVTNQEEVTNCNAEDEPIEPNVSYYKAALKDAEEVVKAVKRWILWKDISGGKWFRSAPSEWEFKRDCWRDVEKALEEYDK